MPVEATVSPITIGLFAPVEEITGGWQEPEYAYRPWAVLGRCHVVFHFGQFVTSKTIKARFQLAEFDDPTPAEVAIAAAEVEQRIANRLLAHGIDPDPIERLTHEASVPLAGAS